MITFATPTTIDAETPVAELVLEAQAGDRAALGEIARRYHGVVYGTALRRLGHEGEAQELAQEVFVQVLRKIGQLRQPECLAGWLRSITNRLALNRLARAKAEISTENATLEAGGNGDGMAIDAEGRLYVTTGPGVQVVGADGKYLGLIPTPRSVISAAFSGKDKKTLYVVAAGALGPDGKEFHTPEGVRNNAKTIYRIQMLAQGFKGRVK